MDRGVRGVWRGSGIAAAATLSAWLTALPVSAAPLSCLGDCNGDGAVTVNELVLGVNIALGVAMPAACPQFDRDQDGSVAVNELVGAVQNALAGCPKDGTPNYVVRGKVLQASGGGGGVSAAAGAEVTANVDRNRNGQVDAGESSTETADADGNYSLALAVADGDRVVVGLRTSDSAPLFRTLEAAAGGDVVLNVTLRTAEELECTGPRCEIPGQRLSIEGLPSGVTGSAQVFNPVTQADAFPGDFADSDGNLLLSGVFASVELTDESGDPVHDLTAPATLRMQVPRETWSVITDISPGNGRIDVPLYAFDEARGTWVRDGAAVLENDAAAVIAEGSLTSIRDGSYAGGVVARGEVDHFSYWNVDWPIASHACLTGRLLTADGAPAAGATVTARGVTYTGTSSATADADGRFCVDVLRSEGPGEDVDQDGVAGETQRVTIRVVHRGRIYDVGEHVVPLQSATCDVGCGTIDDVALTPDRELTPTVCSFTVVVRDRDGQPVPDALVFAVDDTVDADLALELCADTPLGFCFGAGSTDAQGAASLTTVVIDSLFAIAFGTTQDGESTLQRWGEMLFSGCPTSELPITLTDGYRYVPLSVEFVPPGIIRWTPPTYPATGINVASESTAKWVVTSPDAGFLPPVTYGTLPAGALQVFPFDGSTPPPPLASGDSISVYLSAPGDDGYPVLGQGVTAVP